MQIAKGEFKIQNSKFKIGGLRQKKYICVISHFCTDESWRSENRVCKNVEIYLWKKCGAKRNIITTQKTIFAQTQS